MKRYLIKVTYLDGDHKGESYLLRKGGYVTEEKDYQWDDTTYSTYNMALRQCKKLKTENNINIEIERREREWAKAKGSDSRKWNIYTLESYEPYEVEV